MNTKFSFLLFLVVFALLFTAYSSTVTGSSAPIDAAQFMENKTVTPVPITGDPSAETQPPEVGPRLQSGEIFLSDDSNPDVQLKIKTDIQQDLQTECMSEDDQPRLYSGCVE